MKIPGKMWLIIIVKVTKDQGFTLSLEGIFLEKPMGSNLPPDHPPPPFPPKSFKGQYLFAAVLDRKLIPSVFSI